jgi:hypothetical protein
LKTVPNKAIPAYVKEPTVKRTRGCRCKRGALVIPQGVYCLGCSPAPLRETIVPLVSFMGFPSVASLEHTRCSADWKV